MNTAITQLLARKRISTIEECIKAAGAREPVYAAVANGEVFFDMRRDLVINPKAPVYLDQTAWETDKALRIRPPVKVGKSGTIDTQVGSSLCYDGKRGQVVHSDLVSVWLKLDDGSAIKLEVDALPGLISSGRLTSAPKDDGPDTPGHAMVAAASIDRVTRALGWYEKLLPWITGQSKEPLPTRSYRRNMVKFRKAEATLGVGLAGLLDNIESRGNHKPKLLKNVEDAVDLFITNEFGTPKAPNIATSLRLLNGQLRRGGLPTVGRKAFTCRINAIPPEELALKRYGHKVANAVRPPHEAAAISPAGDRAFEIAHIDSTQIDLELISARTGAELPKAWITVVLNVNPPMPLGWHIALHKPNTNSVLMAMRDCVRRHNRLPDTIVHDLGSEHSTVPFQLLKANYHVKFIDRPRGNPRFGAAMESFFNSLKQYVIDQLEGSTK